MIRAIAIILAGLFAQPAIADETADRVVTSFQAWMSAQDVPSGEIAVAYRGQVLARKAIERDAAPVDLASLSKAITASCVSDLVAEGRLAWSSPVRAYLPELAWPLGEVTVADLTTHRGGLWPDTTQGPMAGWRGAGAPVYSDVVSKIANRALGEASYRYNNENYGVLAAVIEAATGEDYASICAAQVFAPLGLESARPSPMFGRFAAWGGWQMGLDDYTRMIWARYGQSAPAALPHADLGGGAFYGLGMVWREFGDGANHWHFGALCFEDGPNFFTFSVLFANGWGAATHVEGCPQEDWFVSLDQAIVTAVFR